MMMFSSVSNVSIDDFGTGGDPGPWRQQAILGRGDWDAYIDMLSVPTLLATPRQDCEIDFDVGAANSKRSNAA
jgi:hypothetical protein